MKIKLGVSLVLAFLAFIFLVQNVGSVRVAFLAWSVEMSLVLLLGMLLAAGIAIGWLLSGYLRFVRNRSHVKPQESRHAETAAGAASGDATRAEGDKHDARQD